MMQKSRIAVTGGIGSGKTVVCGLLSEMGYPVFSCDDISRSLWGDEEYLTTLANAFPSCTKEGKIVKGRLSALVFSDISARKKLESISHPRIMRELLRQMESCRVSFAEVPLLFEGGYEKLFDGVLLVKREKERRIASVIERDHLTESEVQSRISAQLTDAERERSGVVVLENDCSIVELKEKLADCLHRFGL